MIGRLKNQLNQQLPSEPVPVPVVCILLRNVIACIYDIKDCRTALWYLYIVIWVQAIISVKSKYHISIQSLHACKNIGALYICVIFVYCLHM